MATEIKKAVSQPWKRVLARNKFRKNGLKLPFLDEKLQV
jgi:hypothetical protein